MGMKSGLAVLCAVAGLGGLFGCAAGENKQPEKEPIDPKSLELARDPNTGCVYRPDPENPGKEPCFIINY